MGMGGGNSGSSSSSSSGGGGGYTSIKDMFDGGGPGTSGSTFGGALGGVSNKLGFSPYGSGDNISDGPSGKSSNSYNAGLGAPTFDPSSYNGSNRDNDNSTAPGAGTPGAVTPNAPNPFTYTPSYGASAALNPIADPMGYRANPYTLGSQAGRLNMGMATPQGMYGSMNMQPDRNAFGIYRQPTPPTPPTPPVQTFEDQPASPFMSVSRGSKGGGQTAENPFQGPSSKGGSRTAENPLRSDGPSSKGGYQPPQQQQPPQQSYGGKGGYQQPQPGYGGKGGYQQPQQGYGGKGGYQQSASPMSGLAGILGSRFYM